MGRGRRGQVALQGEGHDGEEGWLYMLGSETMVRPLGEWSCKNEYRSFVITLANINIQVRV